MPKINIIYDCEECSYFSSEWCHHPDGGKECSGVDIPDWCPLEDEESNLCTCERCTGLAVESYYEEDSDA